MEVNDIFEKANLAMSWVKKAFIVAKDTALLRTAFLLAVGASIILFQVLAFEYVEYRADAMEKKSTRDVELLLLEGRYKAALESINLCIGHSGEKGKLRDWYCNDAVGQYWLVSKAWPQNRVDQVIKYRAYESMRNDVSNYIRGVEVGRFRNAPYTKFEELKRIMLSNEYMVTFVIVSLVVLTSVFSILQIMSRRVGGKA